MNHFYDIPDPQLIERRLYEYKRDFIEHFFPNQNKKGLRILDLGCGYGLFLHACKTKGYTNLTGVEQQLDIAQHARTHFQLPQIIVDNLEHFISTAKPGSFDLIVAFNIIEHLKKELVPDVLQGIEKLLSPNGLFIMEVPNGDSPLGLHTFYSDITHQSAFTKLLLENLLLHSGFREVEVYPRFVNSNPIIRIGQRLIAKIIGLDDKLMFSGNIVGVGKK